MSRRKLSVLVLAIASVVLSACAAPTAPAHGDSTCFGGYAGSSGLTCG